MTTKAQAFRTQAHFRGRITPSHPSHREFGGQPPVLIPEQEADVGRALWLAQAAGLRAFPRSGSHAAGGDVLSEERSAVISLEAFNGVQVDLTRVEAGAAATAGDLAWALRHHPVFLPLGDLPSRSVASLVLRPGRAPFPRSAPGLRLADCVVGATVVRSEGEAVGAPVVLDLPAWRVFVKEQSPPGVVTRFVVEAAKTQAFESERWFRCWVLPYQPQAFALLAAELFQGSPPDRVDLALRASSGAFRDRLIVLRATGQTEKRYEATRRFVGRALKKVGLPLLGQKRLDGAGASVAGWVGAGPAHSETERYTGQEAELPWREDETNFLEEVGELVARGGWVDLHLGSLYRRALLPPGVQVRPTGVFGQSFSAAPVAAPPRVSPVGEFALAFTHVEGPIPGFRGEVFFQSDTDARYQKAIQQYATSSYDAATVRRRMTPRLVAVPLDSADVIAATRYAAERGLKVVVRSGGHQYCGLSSGGDDTLLLDVQKLEEISLSGTQVVVGPGVALETLNVKLMEAGVSIPHGECPLVNLGGHVQTGGVGHQHRCLGLALDWVRALKLVTLDKSGQAVERSLTLPALADRSPDAELFRAVLGGGPGSWGVLTQVTFEVVPDGKYPASVGYTKTYPYNRPGWAAAFEQFRQWAEREARGDLPDQVDYFLSVISGNLEFRPHANVRPAVVLLETTALTAELAPEIEAVVEAVRRATPLLLRGLQHLVDGPSGSPNGPTPLSRIVGHGVRSRSVLGGMPGGREFDLPYKKSLYVTRSPLPKSFGDRFVDLVHRAETRAGIKVVFQGVLGGGRALEQAPLGTTRMQHRDALVQVVFDIFYEPGFEQVAEEFQAEMKQIWETYLPGERSRMFWGTFEDPQTFGRQLDMSQRDTQDRYYDSVLTYARLQAVKRSADPTNLFATTFTVQP